MLRLRRVVRQDQYRTENGAAVQPSVLIISPNDRRPPARARGPGAAVPTPKDSFMKVRLFAAVLAVAAAPFVARAADEENPYKKAKVGDFATYKMTTKAMGFNVEGTVTQTVVEKDEKEVTIELGGKFMGMDIPATKQKIDLTKPFD